MLRQEITTITTIHLVLEAATCQVQEVLLEEVLVVLLAVEVADHLVAEAEEAAAVKP
jgi:hypothetical protein